MGERPHLLGVDDGPFQARVDREATIVGVVMEGPDLVENVAVTTLPVDGAAVTELLADWVGAQRFKPALQGIVLGGITIAGLGVVDVVELARRTGVPVLAVGRRDPRGHRLNEALAAAGLEARLAIVARTPPAVETERGVFVACAGVSNDRALALVRAATAKADLPEPLRLAHLIARAVVTGASRGRA
jgi:uncharacterized protein